MDRTLEMAHILFMDIVAYSRLAMDQQHEALNHLQEAVRKTQARTQARTNDQPIRRLARVRPANARRVATL